MSSMHSAAQPSTSCRYDHVLLSCTNRAWRWRKIRNGLHQILFFFTWLAAPQLQNSTARNGNFLPSEDREVITLRMCLCANWNIQPVQKEYHSTGQALMGVSVFLAASSGHLFPQICSRPSELEAKKHQSINPPGVMGGAGV